MQTSTIVYDSDKIREFIAESVGQSVRETISVLISEISRKRWLTKEELIELTGWSERTIQHLRDSRQIPFSQHGRKILYPSEGIERFLKKHQVQVRNESDTR